MKGGRGAAGTPHDIALARARAEAGSAATAVPPQHSHSPTLRYHPLLCPNEISVSSRTLGDVRTHGVEGFAWGVCRV